MTTSIRAELPEKLVEEARKFVEAGWAADFIPVTDDFLRRESDQREDGLRRAAFQPEKSNRLKYNQLMADALQRYLESHSADLAEAFIREDTEWGLHGRD